MKAIVQDTYGTADALEFRDVPEPAVGENEVRIHVKAAGAGPDVWHLMTGLPYFARVMPGFRKILHQPRGRDVAGVVESVGASVSGLSPGDEVMGIAEGSFAELAVGTAELLVRKPSRLSFEEAAAAPISGITAVQAVRDVAKVKPGQRVLVIGAGGGTGTLIVQVAKAFGARVTGVASTSKLELVRSIGADEVIDYTRDELAGQWDVVIDTAGRRPSARCVASSRRPARWGSSAARVAGDGPPGSSVRSSVRRSCRCSRDSGCARSSRRRRARTCARSSI